MVNAANPSLQTGSPVIATGVSQRFGSNTVLKTIDLNVAPGEVVALLGPSGCGKTTLLRLLAGLSRPTTGSIHIGDQLVADAGGGTFVPPERRSIGMVFQDYALWPHMTVAQNVGFPLEMQNVGRAKRDTRIAEALGMVGLAHVADRQPGTLSGGQQQRVALARAIVSRPRLVLFDEPLSNLDRELRESLVVDIASLLRKLGMTAVYVTHDHGEAFAIADRVAILHSGNILQIDAPEQLVGNPSSPIVVDFLKLGLVLPADVQGGDLMIGGGARRLSPPAGLVNGSRSGQLFLPRSALLPSNGGNRVAAGHAISGTVVHSMFRGDGYAVQMRFDNDISLEMFSTTRLGDGTIHDLDISWDRAFWFPHEDVQTDHTHNA
ncbi:ABC transporter ATP-binding protein [Thalassospira sp. NFXS8]|uniref:ABC transporter ATP-binding protein n=1 Tax=Thalassospira sp. NFXS8 TaxID=2819093 RepID=UPI0032DF0C83